MKKYVIPISAACVAIALISVLIIVFSNYRVVLSTDNFKINKKTLDCYIELEKNKFIDNYLYKYGDDFLETVGLNPDKSLKRQKSTYGGTWYEYFREKALEDLKTKLLYCEAAKKKEMAIDDSQIQKTESKFKLLFENLSKSDFKKVCEIEALSEIYLKDFVNSISPTQAQMDEFYQNNRDMFDCIDYDCIELSYSSDNPDDTDFANKIIDSIKKIGFEKTVKQFNLSNNASVEIKSQTGYRYNDMTQLGAWAFDPARKAGDVTCFSGRGVYSIYHIKKGLYPFDYTVKKIQKITIGANAKSDDLNKLHQVTQKLEKDGNTDENLFAIAGELGLEITEVDAKQEELNLYVYEWLYNSERKIGDYSILQDGFATSFVRYSSDSDSYFKLQTRDSMFESIINDNLEQLNKDIVIKE